MNLSRVALAAIVAWIASFPFGYAVNDILLAGVTAPNLPVMRPIATIMGNLPIGFAGTLIAFFVVAYMYAKGYEGGSGVAEGFRFGLMLGIIVAGFGVTWVYVTYPVTAVYGAAIVVAVIVELTIYGAIVGAIYKPAAVPNARMPLT